MTEWGKGARQGAEGETMEDTGDNRTEVTDKIAGGGYGCVWVCKLVYLFVNKLGHGRSLGDARKDMRKQEGY